MSVTRINRVRSTLQQGWFVTLIGMVGATCLQAEVSTPPQVSAFAREFCIECHSADVQKGDFRIDTLPWSLSDTDTMEQWQLVYDYVADGDMPTKKAENHPDVATKDKFLEALAAGFEKAAQSAEVGGTPLRRLNRVEYFNSVRDLFGMRMINLPLSFPADVSSAEFDTMPEGLFLSPAVMEAYHESATNIADRFVPLPNPPTYEAKYSVGEIGADGVRGWFGGKGKEYLKFTGFNNSGWVGALWDPIFVAPASGVYRVRLLANAQAEKGADGKPLRLGFVVFDLKTVDLPKRFRLERATLVGEFEIPAGDPHWIDCDIPVESGETFHIYCMNRLAEGTYLNGSLNRAQINKELKKIKARKEPTVELRGMEVAGPMGIPPRVEAFFGSYPPKLDRPLLETRLLPLATRAFRRPLSKREKEELFESVLRHGKKANSPEFAWHYAIRRLLCSPSFLYRESENEKVLDDFALASRLSYFLWSTLPDEELTQLAAAGKLSDPKVLGEQTRRLLADPKADEFIKHFTGQWLGNREVEAINVCDVRYTWDVNVRYGFIRSTEMFFEEILRENLPISRFIDSDFTYANSAMMVAWGGNGNLNSIAADQRQSLVWPEPELLDLGKLPEGLPGHVKDRGGVLGLPGVLTVTGDGVESSPIYRGVWILENMFGEHPPPPPKDVPALDIDTSKATNVREILKAHTELETCAKCHRDIDPLGLALENYDAIGGWRTKYPGDPRDEIDAGSTMANGTQLSGVGSIKEYLLENRQIFTRCLVTKLLEYGAGRKLSVGDQRVVNDIVDDEPDSGYRFADLIETAVRSEVFRTK